MKYILSIFCVLAALWLGNSGHYSLPLIAFGLVSVLFVVWLAHRMNVIDHESQPLYLMGRKLPAYYGWLVVKIIRSNIDVVCRIWRGDGAISPTVATLPMMQVTDMGRVIYANSITLTPGTVAMDLEGDQVLVHALTEDGIKELADGEMNRRVARLESGG